MISLSCLGRLDVQTLPPAFSTPSAPPDPWMRSLSLPELRCNSEMVSTVAPLGRDGFRQPSGWCLFKMPSCAFEPHHRLRAIGCRRRGLSKGTSSCFTSEPAVVSRRAWIMRS